MANYITTLQARVKTADDTIGEALAYIADFREHLASAKFSGADSDGARKDWIATSDVNSRLSDLVSLLTID